MYKKRGTTFMYLNVFIWVYMLFFVSLHFSGNFSVWKCQFSCAFRLFCEGNKFTFGWHKKKKNKANTNTLNEIKLEKEKKNNESEDGYYASDNDEDNSESSPVLSKLNKQNKNKNKQKKGEMINQTKEMKNKLKNNKNDKTLFDQNIFELSQKHRSPSIESFEQSNLEISKEFEMTRNEKRKERRKLQQKRAMRKLEKKIIREKRLLR